MPRRPTVVRHREAGSTRDVILDAAERRFAEQGFAGVSVREIAADAGLKNQASLYHHFKSKRAIYEAVLTRGIEPILGIVGESASDGDGSDAFLERLVDYLADHPHLPQLIQRAALEDRRYLPSAVPRLIRPLYARGIQALQDAFEGPWDPTDVPYLALALYHMIFGYFANAALIEAVAQSDPRAATAVGKQRRFIKAAFARLMRRE